MFAEFEKPTGGVNEGKLSSQPPRPGLMEGVVLILMAWLAGKLPAMVVRCHRTGKRHRTKSESMGAERTKSPHDLWARVHSDRSPPVRFRNQRAPLAANPEQMPTLRLIIFSQLHFSNSCNFFVTGTAR